ncbi:hypothetical protein FACS189427_11650 [Planctomycetales bacterium]|nr:hypothetical protein FACS189427_11650 [Planctomycetales bacterium]
MNLDDLLIHKNPYLFRAKNVLTAYDIIKGFADAFLQSQEETLFGEFIEGLAIFVCSQNYNAKKADMEGLDLIFEKKNIVYGVEIKAGWNWGNAAQIRDFKMHSAKNKSALEKATGKQVEIINGCCFGKVRNRNPEKAGYYKMCGQEFWTLISDDEELYVNLIEPIGHKAKQRNEQFDVEYAAMINKFTVQFANRFCEDGKIDWHKLVRFNSEKKS